MGRTTRLIGASSILLAPLLTAVGYLIGIAIYPPTPGGPVNDEYGTDQALADLAAIDEHRGLYALAGALVLVVAMIGIPALLAVWRLTVDRSRRWAWAGAVLAGFGVIGGAVHAVDPGLHLVALETADRAAAADFLVVTSTHPYVVGIFLPVLIGFLAFPVQAVGLVRARVVPLWAGSAIGVGGAVLYLFGSTIWGVVGATLLLLAGFAPAAAAMLDRRSAAVETPDLPVSA